MTAPVITGTRVSTIAHVSFRFKFGVVSIFKDGDVVVWPGHVGVEAAAFAGILLTPVITGTGSGTVAHIRSGGKVRIADANIDAWRGLVAAAGAIPVFGRSGAGGGIPGFFYCRASSARAKILTSRT